MTKALVIEEWQVRNTTGQRVAVAIAPARKAKLVDENIAIVWSCQGAKATSVKAQIFGSKGPYPDEDAIDMLCPGSLYPRVFTEGLFGIVPTGLDSFECTPWLPRDWPRMALRDVRAFGQAWDLVVERAGAQQKITVKSGGRTVMTGVGPAGKTYSVTL